MKFKKAVGMGMNEYELSQNKQINEFVVRDLNKDPNFPFEANTFDFVTCVVSVDYLTKPLEVFKEINRVLKPGSICVYFFIFMVTTYNTYLPLVVYFNVL